MALDRNKAGILAAISAATEGVAPVKGAKAGPDGVAASAATSTPTQSAGSGEPRSHRNLPRGTVGSVRAGLGGIQEIETAHILPWGPQDRIELTAVNSGGGEADGEIQDLAASIREAGQQVPVLLRPAPQRDGKFEVVYGRRRILACQELGIPVKALIRTLDDSAALKAKGLENAGRRDLSFYERARFAQAILDQGHSREEALAALGVSKATLSQLERVARLIPDMVGFNIGPAPGAGRPKWMTLAAAFETGRIDAERAGRVLAGLPLDTPSDQRLAAVIDSLTARGPSQSRAIQRTPVAGAAVKSTNSSVTLTVKRAGESKAFAEWFDANVDRLLEDSYRAFQAENGGEGG